MSATHQSDFHRLVCRRRPVAPGALAPVSTGWMRNPAGSRASVNLTLEGAARRCAPGCRRSRRGGGAPAGSCTPAATSMRPSSRSTIALTCSTWPTSGAAPPARGSLLSRSCRRSASATSRSPPELSSRRADIAPREASQPKFWGHEGSRATELATARPERRGRGRPRGPAPSDALSRIRTPEAFVGRRIPANPVRRAKEPSSPRPRTPSLSATSWVIGSCRRRTAM